MPKHITAVESTPLRVVIVTLDNHLASATARAARELKRELPNLHLSLHAATEWNRNCGALERCRKDIEQGDIIIVTMMFMEEHVEAVLPSLQARRDKCDVMVACMSTAEIMRLTRMGNFKMDGSQGGPIALLKRLRGGRKKGATAGAQQLAIVRRLPQILRFIPGTAQDVRAYFLTMQYWLAGSERNVVNMVRFLADRYSAGPRASLRGNLKAALPANYPDVGVYHPRLRGRISERAELIPKQGNDSQGTIGLLVMRSYVLAGDTGHYDGVIEALESRGFNVIPIFASGLDSRPAIEKYFIKDGRPQVDAVASLTGFSLVGGPAYNDAKAAEDMLARLDVPYLAALAVEFQAMEQWESSDRGLMPIEATMMVAISELDGSTSPMVFGGRLPNESKRATRDMQVHEERSKTLANRIGRLVELRRRPRAERKIGVVLFNFPPNGGSTGTAAHLSVFESLFRTLRGLKSAGYNVDLPGSVSELRTRVLQGNAKRFGTDANVAARIPVDDHVRREPWLTEIEEQWGPAPGRHQSDGSSIFVLGETFGNVFVGVQPAFGYEGDPMRLLFEKGFAPTHAFSAFYRFMREDFGANAVMHFGTHGALEFMPGKQVGLSDTCWPDRLIGDLPNYYLYAANNPSEGTIAKRRGGATLISYLTPPVTHAGLYRGLNDLKSSIIRFRGLPPEAQAEREDLAALIQSQAVAVDLGKPEPAWTDDSEVQIGALWNSVLEVEETLIPHGLHVVGEPVSKEERRDLLRAAATAAGLEELEPAALAMIEAGGSAEEAIEIGGLEESEEHLSIFRNLSETSRLLAQDHEVPAIIHALDGGFVRPAPGGDLIRAPEILPTGRNLHGFDPFRLPSAFAVVDGARQAERLLQRHRDEGNSFPESIAFVLWGSDNLKSEGGPIAQVMALIGARPRFDSYGRLAGASLIPLEELGRPRIDVVTTLSGIFRDLLPLQTKMLAEATFLAASAEEPLDQNFIRKHSLQHQKRHGCDLDTAALRVFSNADGAYGSNVNHLVDSGCWSDEDELAQTYTQRKCFAYGRDGIPESQAELLKSVLESVDLTYQNLESVEVGVTTLDHYFDTLGGISRSVQHAKGTAVPVYIGDQTQGQGKVRTLGEQVSLETRTRMLNPKWYEGMLEHGYEGVRQIEAHVTNTVGWSATTGQVGSWVYQQITQTYVLDDEMRERLAALNPVASVKVANRLLEAHERNYWSPDEKVLKALRQAGEELEDRLEGVRGEVAA